MPRRPLRIGVYGGSFDPVHTGHVALLKAAKKSLKLDRVFVVPSFRTPLRGPRVASPAERLAMVRLALRGLKWASASPVEVRRGGKSYTVDTVRAFRRRFKTAELYLIAGSDAARGFSKWKSPDQIVELCRVAASRRAGEAPPPKQFLAFPMKPAAPNATRIREELSRGRRAPSGWLDPAVAAYIERRGLYRTASFVLK